MLNARAHLLTQIAFSTSQTVHSVKQLPGPLQIWPQLVSHLLRAARARSESGAAVTVVRVARMMRRERALSCMLLLEGRIEIEIERNWYYGRR